MQLKKLLVISILFYQCGSGSTVHTYKPADILNYPTLNWNSDTSTLIFTGTLNITLKPIPIKPGKYVIKFTAQGNTAQNIMPYVRMFLGNAYIYDDSIRTGVNNYTAKFEIKEETADSIHFELRNGYSGANENRNVVLHFPLELKPY